MWTSSIISGNVFVFKLKTYKNNPFLSTKKLHIYPSFTKIFYLIKFDNFLFQKQKESSSLQLPLIYFYLIKMGLIERFNT